MEWIFFSLFALGSIPVLIGAAVLWPVTILMTGYYIGGGFGFIVTIGLVLLIIGIKESL